MRTPRPASLTPTTRGRRSPASATACIPSSTSWAGITRIPTSAFFSRVMICSSTSISSHSRSRWPTWSIRSARPGASSSGAESALVQVSGFFLMAGRGERQALARLVNDLESIPNTDGGGGGLSPRLEAELLAMLTRTSYPQATSNERTLTAGLFALLGMVAGAVLVLALLWLVQLNRSLQDQADRIDQIARNVDRSSAAQRLALETLLANSESTETANGPDAFVTQYRKTGRLLDEARGKLEKQTTINGTLATRLLALDSANTKLKKELDVAKTYESDAKEVARLREKVAELETENKKQDSKLADQQEVLEAVPARGAARLVRQYNRAWYAAAAGWSFAAVLALGLAAAFGLKPLPDHDPEAVSPPGVPPEDRPEEPPPLHIT